MKVLMCMMMLFTSALGGSQVSVVADFCYLYSSPSFEEVIEFEGSPLKLEHTDTLSVIEDDGSTEFIKVKVEDKNIEGYVYRYYVTYNSPSQEVYPVFNGRVTKDDAVIYDLNKEPTTYRGKNGQGIYLYAGFSGKESMNAVAIVLEDGTLFYGFMDTKEIAPNGVSGGLITGLVVIATCLTIIFLLLFMKKNKRH